MITIDFNSFSPEDDNLKESCIEFVQNILDNSEKITIKKCVKGKKVKNVKAGAKCPKGYKVRR